MYQVALLLASTLTSPAVAHAFLGKPDLAAVDVAFRKGQEEFNQGRFLSATRTWMQPANHLPETAEHQDDRAAIYDYIAEAYEKDGAATCFCAPGWEGDDCSANIDDGAADPCVHGACTDGDFSCACDPGGEGEHCAPDIDDRGIACSPGQAARSAARRAGSGPRTVLRDTPSS